MLQNEDYSASLLNGARYLQPVVDRNSRKKRKWREKMSLQTAFDAQLYFVVLFPLTQEVGLRKLSVLKSAMNRMLTGMAVQLLQSALDATTNFCLLGPLCNAIRRYMCFNPAVIQFQVLSQPVDGFVSLKPAEMLFKSKEKLLGPDTVLIVARCLSSLVDEAISIPF